MLGLWRNNPLTNDAKRKLRYFKSSYNFNAQYDVATTLFVIVKMLRPDTRARCSDIKYKLENMKMYHLKHDTHKANLQIKEQINYISITGETYSEIVG